MNQQDRIDIDIFKVVTKAVSESDDLEIIPSHLCQLLVAALEIKACSLFLLNRGSGELERVADFGLSTRYLAKGPVFAEKSLGCTLVGKPIIITDVESDERVQYPQDAVKEGIVSILSFPLVFQDRVMGCLRLYEHEKWEISERDKDSLLLLAEIIGLALSYSRLRGAVRTFDEVIKGLDLEPGAY